MHKISIITVCKNDLDNLKKTLKSIFSQTYDNYELIVIDGGSTDGSEAYLEKIKFNNFKYISEQDQGIYDAMNKGVALSNGNWLYFLNAGDIFFSERVLNQVSLELISSSHFICGKIIYKFKKSLIEISPRQLINWNTRLLAHHQGVFISKNVFNEFQFDKKFKLRAESAFFYKAYRLGYKFKNIGITFAYYDPYGISSKVSFRHFYEGLLIEPNFFSLYRCGYTLKYIFTQIPKIFIRCIIKK